MSSLEPDCGACGHRYDQHLGGWGRCFSKDLSKRTCDCTAYEFAYDDAVPLRAVLDCELWLMAPEDPSDDLPVLVLPLARTVDGRGAPGILTPGPLRVLKPGTIVEVV